jgi:protein SCO1
MKSRHFFFLGMALAVIMTTVVGVTLFAQPYKYQGSVIEPPLEIQDIELTDQYGQPFSLSGLLDGDDDIRAVLVFFGFTHCPDVCPITLGEFKQIEENLGNQADFVRFVFITVDPERDTPEILQRHLALYNPAFIGLTGSWEELEPVWKTFYVDHIRREVSGGSGYLIDHTTRVYVIDRHSRVGLTFSFGEGSEAMTQDIAHMTRRP